MSGGKSAKKQKLRIRRPGIRVRSPPARLPGGGPPPSPPKDVFERVQRDTQRFRPRSTEDEQEVVSSGSGDESNSSSLPLPAVAPVVVARRAPPQDSTLKDIINLRKVRAVKLKDDEVSSAASSDRVRNCRSLLLSSKEDDDDSGTEADTESESDVVPARHRHRREHRKHKHKHRHHKHRHHREKPLTIRLTPEEAHLQGQIEKAKLLARIEQLQERGLTPSKKYSFKSSVDEMRVEVAKLEVIACRNSRIEQGRAMFMMTIGGLEKGCNTLDTGRFVQDPEGEEGEGWHESYIPGLGGDRGWQTSMDGFSKAVLADIEKYDDCLERGVEEVLGPQDGRKWYIDLLFLLIPAMIMYSMTNRLKNDPAHTSEVLKRNPQFRAEMARELAKELAKEHREGKWTPSSSISSSESSPPSPPRGAPRRMKPAPRPPPPSREQPVTPQGNQMIMAHGPYQAAPRMVPANAPNIRRDQPPPIEGRAHMRPQQNYHPGGDIEPNNEHTRMMLAERQRQAQMQRMRELEEAQNQDHILRFQQQFPPLGPNVPNEEEDDDDEEDSSDYGNSPLTVRTGKDKDTIELIPDDDEEE